MRVLGIETSCDETGIAIYDDQQGLLANQLYSQVKLHADYGGVVPELASRDHVRKTVPLIQEALKESGLTAKDIDAVAYTAGPGLVGALLVGATVGRSLAFAWDVPAIPVHHMEGHLLAPMLEDNPPEFPFVALLVSGVCNLMALDDKTAQGIGLNVSRWRIAISLIAVVLASVSTAVAGVVSFVGLIVPHIARILVGNNHKVLIPFTILLGALIFLTADTIGRILAAPYEISASIVMAVAGGPFFIALLRGRGNYGS